MVVGEVGGVGVPSGAGKGPDSNVNLPAGFAKTTLPRLIKFMALAVASLMATVCPVFT